MAKKKENKAPAKPKTVVVQTVRPVEFQINRVKFSGTSFKFSAKVAEDRKKFLRDSFGADIIVEASEE